MVLCADWVCSTRVFRSEFVIVLCCACVYEMVPCVQWVCTCALSSELVIVFVVRVYGT